MMKKKKQRGQAIIEYVILLAIAVLAATAYFSMDETIRWRIGVIAADLVDGSPPGIALPDPEDTPRPSERLSPPVADFMVPTPNWKGRDIRLVDRSFDIDGVVSHYIWNINGQERRQTRAEVEAANGIVINFRHSGTYPVSLIVIDNDGLVSNMVTRNVVVENRHPTVSMSVRSHRGVTGSAVDAWQFCSATFFTQYGDEDLPHDVLTLHSTFSDHRGLETHSSTVPNEFTRLFMNQGLNRYTVRVTDEDGAFASRQVSVNVVRNPNVAPGHLNPLSIPESVRCGDPAPPPPAVRCQLSLTVTGHISSNPSTRTYTFAAGSRGTVTANVTWGTHPAHSQPLHWTTTERPNANIWTSDTQIEAPQAGVWQVGGDDIVVRATARDASAVSSTPDPSLIGMCTPAVEVRLVSEPPAATLQQPPAAALSVSFRQFTASPPRTDPVTIDVGAGVSNPNFNCAVGRCTLTINPTFSTAATGRTIRGMRFNIPDGVNADGSQRFRWVPSNRTEFPSAFEVEEQGGVRSLWLPFGSTSPDTAGGRVFIRGEGSGRNRDTWIYELQVIDDLGTRSNNTARITVVLAQTISPPTAVCTLETSPLIVQPLTAFNTRISALGSTDPQGFNLYAEWSIDSGATWVAGGPITSNPPVVIHPASAAGQVMTNIRLRVVANGRESPMVTCPVTVGTPPPPPPPPTPQRGMLTLNWMSITNRVALANVPITVENTTRNMSDVPIDSSNRFANGVFWGWVTTAHARDQFSYRSVLGSRTAARTTLRTTMGGTTLVTGESGVPSGAVGATGAIDVWLHVTDIEGSPTCDAASHSNQVFCPVGNPNCSPAAPTTSPNFADPRLFCRKSTTYWRMSPFSYEVNVPGLPRQRCEQNRIRHDFTDPVHYRDRWPLAWTERWNNIYISELITNMILLRNCVPF